MNFPMFAERRMAIRQQLTGLLPGKMSIQGKDGSLDCKPVDISRHGLGILTTEQLSPGTVLLLKLKDQEIALDIVWGKPDFGKRDLFRYGLMARNQQLDLEQLFKAHGCLIEK